MPFEIKKSDRADFLWEVHLAAEGGGVEIAAVFEEERAFQIAASLNMMEARNRNGTPFSVLAAAMVDVITAAAAIIDCCLAMEFGAFDQSHLSRLHELCETWKTMQADIMDEAIRRSKA